MRPALSCPRPFWLLIASALGLLVLGFVCWLIGNPDFKHPSAYKEWCARAGLVFILAADLGGLAALAKCARDWTPPARFWASVLVAVLLSLLGLVILFLEYGVLNFGDSDLPPYQPDTPFERAFDFLFWVVTIGAMVFWSGAVLYAVLLLSKYFKRRLA